MNKYNERNRQSQLPIQLANIGLLFDQLLYLIHKVEEIDDKIQNQQSSSTDEKEDIIQVKEAARIIGRSVSTVYIKASKRQIPCWNDGGRLLFSRKDLTEHILANKDKQEKETHSDGSIKDQMKKNRKKYTKKK